MTLEIVIEMAMREMPDLWARKSGSWANTAKYIADAVRQELGDEISLETAKYRIAQLESALVELLVEIKNSRIYISKSILRAWTNANNVLNTGKI